MYNIRMNTKIIVVGIAVFIVGGGIGYALGNNESNMSANQNQHIMPDDSMMHGQMDDMMTGLRGKTGDAFDQAFISEMIVHHEGAVDMAEAALMYAKHEEIKQMASAIISAQTAEIKQMQEWQKAWYGE